MVFHHTHNWLSTIDFLLEAQLDALVYSSKMLVRQSHSAASSSKLLSFLTLGFQYGFNCNTLIKDKYQQWYVEKVEILSKSKTSSRLIVDPDAISVNQDSKKSLGKNTIFKDVSFLCCCLSFMAVNLLAGHP